MSYTPTIGLEVHAELNTKSKMFCSCANDPHDSEANANTCPVCLAHPGTLPVANEQAIEKVLLFGQAVGATVAEYTEFDRKNYFYPDIPKAYQISQYQFPFLQGGAINDVELTRVHLEEDTARSQHDQGVGSVVDFNRAGVPLMELVTEPVIHDAETAGRFAKELQLIMRTIGISDANMERGEMRIEANISVSEGETLGTKVEVKNLNSFRSVTAAIEYEIERQIQCLQSDEELVQETRGWDEVKQRTFSQRAKETAHDYRYFPDPDLPKMKISEHAPFSSSRLSEIMPVLPAKKREIYGNLGLTSEQIELLIQNSELDRFFASLVKVARSGESDDARISKLAVNYLTSDVAALLESGHDLVELQEEHFLELMRMLNDNKIGSRVAKDLLPQLFASQDGPKKLAAEQNLLQVSDDSTLLPLVEAVIEENQAVFEEYRSGKEAALKFLLGQVMRRSKGAADPRRAQALLEERAKSS